MSVPGADSDHASLESSLGLYLLGALPAEETAAFERHLAVCDECCAEADGLGDAVATLVMLPPRDLDELAEQYGAPAHEPTA
jgi:anti-sigma factor RsiW